MFIHMCIVYNVYVYIYIYDDPERGLAPKRPPCCAEQVAATAVVARNKCSDRAGVVATAMTRARSGAVHIYIYIYIYV